MMLASADNAGEHIAEPLDKVAQKIKSIDLWDSNGSNDFTHNRNIIGAWLALKFRGGDHQTVREYLDELIEDKPKDRDWTFNQMMEGLISKLSAPVQEEMMTASSPAEMSKLLPLLRTLADKESVSYTHLTLPTICSV